MYSCNISVQKCCEKDGTHKKNIINVKYSSNVQIITSMIITCFNNIVKYYFISWNNTNCSNDIYIYFLL